MKKIEWEGKKYKVKITKRKKNILSILPWNKEQRKSVPKFEKKYLVYSRAGGKNRMN